MDIRFDARDPGRLLFGGAEGLKAVADCLTSSWRLVPPPVDGTTIDGYAPAVKPLLAFRNKRRVTVV
jgi:hypothetical protein